MKSDIDSRIKIVMIIGFLLAAGIVLWTASLMRNDTYIQLKAETEDQYDYTTIDVTSERGNIYDRQGYLLAGNTVTYSVSLNLQASNGHGDFIAENIAGIFDLDPDMIRKAAEVPYKTGSSVEYTITHNASKAQVERLEELRNTLALRPLSKTSKLEDLDSVVYYPNVHRYYPDNELAYNIIGFYPFLNGNGKAVYGIEEYYDDILAAETVSHRFALDPNVPDRIPDLPNGASIVLTIDRKVQKICEDIINRVVKSESAKSGTIIIEDPKTGEILAMATAPNVNLNEYWKISDIYTKDNLFNPAVMQPYEPGSVFKVITLASAIDSGVIEPTTVYNDTGVYNVMGTSIMNWDRGAWGPQTMVGCMQHSLNTCLSWMASQVGAERFYNYLEAFGLDDPTGIELAEEDYRPISKPGNASWTLIELSTNSFGQGLMETPIQMVQAVSAIANGGVMMKPHIVREIHYNNSVEKVEPEVIGHPISAESAATVTEMLATSIEVESSDASVDNIRIAGKTGTGEISVGNLGYITNLTNASFVGWGPADDPQFVVYVWLQEPKNNMWGSEVSAPVFSEVVSEVAPYLRIPDDRTRLCLTTDVCPTEEPEEYYWY